MLQNEKLFNTMSNLLNYRKEDWNTLKAFSETTSTWTPIIVQFYSDTLRDDKPAGDIIQPNEQPDIKKLLTEWYSKLVRGDYEKDFWRQHWILGLLFIQSGVNIIFLTGMINQMNEIFLKKCLETFDSETTFEVYVAYHRITGAAMSLISEVYYNILLKSSIRLGMNETLVRRVVLQDVKKRLEQSHVE